MSTPANFNGKKPMIDPGDSAMLLVDHQSGLFQTVGDMEMTVLRAHVIALAKIATLSKIPVITTASVPEGPNGPQIPEIHENAPRAQYVARKGQINAWDNPDFVAAVRRFPHELDQYSCFGRSIVDYRLCARLSNDAACRPCGRLANERQ